MASVGLRSRCCWKRARREHEQWCAEVERLSLVERHEDGLPSFISSRVTIHCGALYPFHPPCVRENGRRPVAVVFSDRIAFWWMLLMRPHISSLHLWERQSSEESLVGKWTPSRRIEAIAREVEARQVYTQLRDEHLPCLPLPDDIIQHIVHLAVCPFIGDQTT